MQAQDEVAAPDASASAPPAATEASDASDEPPHWFLGAYYRHDWIPSYMLSAFFSRAPSITNDGFGLTISHRADDGFTLQMGIGYMPYTIRGAFTADGTLVEDTEYIRSDLALVHLTGSILWPIQLHETLTFEFGFGLDLGVFLDKLVRTEAYPDARGNFHPCRGALDPATVGDDKDLNGDAIRYCAVPLDAEGNAIKNPDGSYGSNGVKDKGEQYHVKETRIPGVMAFPMLPHLALRFAPWKSVAFKLEFAFGVAQIWAGASVHLGFGGGKPIVHETEEPPPPPREVAVVHTGRVLGKLMDKATQTPIAGAAVRSARLLSVLQTDEGGLFVADHLDPGPVRFDFTHPDYGPGFCATQIPEDGGDIPLHCFLVATPTDGAISGQVKDEQGAPIAHARVTIMGPAVNGEVLTSREGLFALPDAAAGSYRIRVDAEGFLMQLVVVDVVARDTAMPQIVLMRKPDTSLVTLKASEISISQQINFETNSAEIGASSDALMREIADVILRHDEIAHLEIQGHTDNKGGEEHNLELSQARADSVRDRLVSAGVAPERLRAKGYGQERPLVPNNTPANRAKNRRVQLIIIH